MLGEADIEKLSKKCGTLLQKVLKITKLELGITLCHSCHRYLMKNKMPRIAEANGLALDPIPEALQNLTDLEEQLIALNLLFMKIKLLPTQRVKGIKDRVIHVPLEDNDVFNTIQSLPRPPDKAALVPVHFKRFAEII